MLPHTTQTPLDSSLSLCQPSEGEVPPWTLPGGEATATREMVAEPGRRGPVRCLRTDVADLKEEGGELQAKEGQGHRHPEAATKGASRPGHPTSQGEEGEGRQTTTKGGPGGDEYSAPTP